MRLKNAMIVSITAAMLGIGSAGAQDSTSSPSEQTNGLHEALSRLQEHVRKNQEEQKRQQAVEQNEGVGVADDQPWIPPKKLSTVSDEEAKANFQRAWKHSQGIFDEPAVDPKQPPANPFQKRWQNDWEQWDPEVKNKVESLKQEYFAITRQLSAREKKIAKYYLLTWTNVSSDQSKRVAQNIKDSEINEDSKARLVDWVQSWKPLAPNQRAWLRLEVSSDKS